MLTDAVPARKVVLFVQVEAPQDQALQLRLEEAKPEGIKLVKVHPFDYILFDDSELRRADLFVVRASDLETFLPDFAPLDAEDWDDGGREPFLWEGRVYGVKIYDAASGTGAAMDYLGYDPGEDYYLCMNARSLHLGSGDGAALRIAEALLKLS